MRLFICCLAAVALCAAETTGVEAILAKDVLEFGDVADLRQAVDTGEVAQRIAVLDAIAKSGHAEAIDAVQRGLEANEAEVAIAAIRTVEALGPARPEDAERIRGMLQATDADLAATAAAYVAQAKDDRAIPVLIRRLSWRADDQAARAALVGLTGQDLQQSTDWEQWYAQKQEATTALVDMADTYIASDTSATVLEGVALLVSAKERPSEVVERLIALAAHADPAVASLAQAGLQTCAGPLASRWRADHLATARAAQSAATGTSVPSQGAVAIAAPPGSTAAASAGVATQPAPPVPTSSALWPVVMAILAVAGGLWFLRRRPVAKSTVAAPDPAAHGREVGGKNHLQITFIK